jgi:hypothetical protein
MDRVVVALVLGDTVSVFLSISTADFNQVAISSRHCRLACAKRMARFSQGGVVAAPMIVFSP